MADGAVVGEDGVPRCPWASRPGVMQDYHDTEWGVPVRGERGMFERLSLEGFQAGLSWLTILNKRDRFRDVFHDFDVDQVAAMTDEDLDVLMTDTGIVRNRAKIVATRRNARATVELRDDGGLEAFID
ncbi:DNA-3-methyladenine glycosylase I, partial [Pseudomonas sp. 100_A]|uniref:DNA-3-methyladenine glycosylase I n=1 Tax=Pseudomonas sp. 100_A TaxID=2813571 RepID=UPI0034D1999E